MSGPSPPPVVPLARRIGPAFGDATRAPLGQPHPVRLLGGLTSHDFGAKTHVLGIANFHEQSAVSGLRGDASWDVLHIFKELSFDIK